MPMIGFAVVFFTLAVSVVVFVIVVVVGLGPDPTYCLLPNTRSREQTRRTGRRMRELCSQLGKCVSHKW